MLGALVASGGLGLLIGLRYRAPALLVASIAVAVAAIIVGQLATFSPLASLALVIGVVTVLQCGYLGGVALAVGAARPNLLRSSNPGQLRAQSTPTQRVAEAGAVIPHRRRAEAARRNSDRDAAARENCLATD